MVANRVVRAISMATNRVAKIRVLFLKMATRVGKEKSSLKRELSLCSTVACVGRWITWLPVAVSI
jgi:hypothetical protein